MHVSAAQVTIADLAFTTVARWLSSGTSILWCNIAHTQAEVHINRGGLRKINNPHSTWARPDMPRLTSGCAGEHPSALPAARGVCDQGPGAAEGG